MTIYSTFLVNCQWSNWSAWGSCTRSCGSGTQKSTRSKTVQESNGGTCSGLSEKSQSCNNQGCPVMVKGVITLGNGKPVENAEVKIEGIDKTIYSTDRGEYWTILTPGEYVMTVNKRGYKMRKINISIPNSQSEPIIHNVTLSIDLAGVIGIISVGNVGDVDIPIENAEVKIEGTDETIYSTDQGVYHINLTPGEYVMTVYKEGFKRKTISISIPNSQSGALILNVALEVNPNSDGPRNYKLQMEDLNDLLEHLLNDYLQSQVALV